MDPSTIGKVVTVLSLGVSGIAFLLTLTVLVLDARFGGGNHSLLFGTVVDRLLLRRPTLLALGLSLPLVVPLFLERNGLTVGAALGSVFLFLFLRLSFVHLQD